MRRSLGEDIDKNILITKQDLGGFSFYIALDLALQIIKNNLKKERG